MMQRTHWILIASVAAMVALVALLMQGSGTPSRNNSIANSKADAGGDSHGSSAASSKAALLLHCAASNRAVIEAIEREYEKETGRQVDIQFGASQALLSAMEVSRNGDLFLPADDSFIQMATDKHLVAEVIPIATMRAVVAVPKGNPKSIRSLNDLVAPKLRFVQASPDATAIGRVTRKTLEAQGQWEKLAMATTAFRTTVNEAANDVSVGAADASIVYDAVLHTYPSLEAVRIPELEAVVSQVSIGVCKSSQDAAAALHFARYVAARDRGLKRYAEYGFQVTGGDKWSERPELSIFAGSMLRPAIDETIVDFENREGIRVSRVYNGCGILVAQMKAGQHPDAYFACDREFMNSLPDLFPSPTDVSQNELAILVPKGNPRKIRNLRDLGTPGLRVGIGHEKQCAMGWLTQNTLRDGGVQKEVMANVTVQTPTGDMLVNQLRAGGLDAAVAYVSNAAGSAEFLDAIQITGIPCSIATQPFAVAVDSNFPNLAQRLLARIKSAESKEAFLAEGFKWSADLPAASQND